MGSPWKKTRSILLPSLEWILGDTIADSLPVRRSQGRVMTLLIDPKNSTFTLRLSSLADCSFNLGIAIFTLTADQFQFQLCGGQRDG